MPVVSNTSTLLNLAIARHLNLLRQQFGEVLIPPAVRAELKADSDFPGAAELQQALADGWVREVALTATHTA